MIDNSKIISSFGKPAKEYILYADCEYLFNDTTRCLYKGRITDNSIDNDSCLIELIKDKTEHIVPISSLSPIPLTIKYFDFDQNESDFPIGAIIKEWKYKNSVIPYKIQYNGAYFVYSDTRFEKAGAPPTPITYLSDLQAIRASYLS